MKAPIAVISDGRVLRPADAYAAEQIDALPRGDRLNARITQERSPGKLALYWAGLGLLSENLSEEHQARWPTARKLHNMLMEAHGYVEQIWRIDGTFRLVPDSIAMNNMEEAEFEQYREQARGFVVRNFGFDPWEMWVAEKEAEKAMRRARR